MRVENCVQHLVHRIYQSASSIVVNNTMVVECSTWCGGSTTGRVAFTTSMLYVQHAGNESHNG
jgi:hypothetical protein